MSGLVEELRARRLPPLEQRRSIRRDAGVSQERLARELGVHRVTVARWELGRDPRGRLRERYLDLLAALQAEVALQTKVADR